MGFVFYHCKEEIKTGSSTKRYILSRILLFLKISKMEKWKGRKVRIKTKTQIHTNPSSS
jgi:hypothetical protein